MSSNKKNRSRKRGLSNTYSEFTAPLKLKIISVSTEEQKLINLEHVTATGESSVQSFPTAAQCNDGKAFSNSFPVGRNGDLTKNPPKKSSAQRITDCDSGEHEIKIVEGFTYSNSQFMCMPTPDWINEAIPEHMHTLPLTPSEIERVQRVKDNVREKSLYPVKKRKHQTSSILSKTSEDIVIPSPRTPPKSSPGIPSNEIIKQLPNLNDPENLTQLDSSIKSVQSPDPNLLSFNTPIRSPEINFECWQTNNLQNNSETRRVYPPSHSHLNHQSSMVQPSQNEEYIQEDKQQPSHLLPDQQKNNSWLPEPPPNSLGPSHHLHRPCSPLQLCPELPQSKQDNLQSVDDINNVNNKLQLPQIIQHPQAESLKPTQNLTLQKSLLKLTSHLPQSETKNMLRQENYSLQSSPNVPQYTALSSISSKDLYQQSDIYQTCTHKQSDASLTRNLFQSTEMISAIQTSCLIQPSKSPQSKKDNLQAVHDINIEGNNLQPTPDIQQPQTVSVQPSQNLNLERNLPELSSPLSQLDTKNMHLQEESYLQSSPNVPQYQALSSPSSKDLDQQRDIYRTCTNNQSSEMVSLIQTSSLIQLPESPQCKQENLQPLHDINNERNNLQPTPNMRQPQFQTQNSPPSKDLVHQGDFNQSCTNKQHLQVIVPVTRHLIRSTEMAPPIQTGNEVQPFPNLHRDSTLNTPLSSECFNMIQQINPLHLPVNDPQNRVPNIFQQTQYVTQSPTDTPSQSIRFFSMIQAENNQACRSVISTVPTNHFNILQDPVMQQVNLIQSSITPPLAQTIHFIQSSFNYLPTQTVNITHPYQHPLQPHTENIIRQSENLRHTNPLHFIQSPQNQSTNLINSQYAIQKLPTNISQPPKYLLQTQTDNSSQKSPNSLHTQKIIPTQSSPNHENSQIQLSQKTLQTLASNLTQPSRNSHQPMQINRNYPSQNHLQTQAAENLLQTQETNNLLQTQVANLIQVCQNLLQPHVAMLTPPNPFQTQAANLFHPPQNLPQPQAANLIQLSQNTLCSRVENQAQPSPNSQQTLTPNLHQLTQNSLQIVPTVLNQPSQTDSHTLQIDKNYLSQNVLQSQVANLPQSSPNALRLQTSNPIQLSQDSLQRTNSSQLSKNPLQTKPTHRNQVSQNSRQTQTTDIIETPQNLRPTLPSRQIRPPQNSLPTRGSANERTECELRLEVREQTVKTRETCQKQFIATLSHTFPEGPHVDIRYSKDKTIIFGKIACDGVHSSNAVRVESTTNECKAEIDEDEIVILT